MVYGFNQGLRLFFLVEDFPQEQDLLHAVFYGPGFKLNEPSVTVLKCFLNPFMKIGNKDNVGLFCRNHVKGRCKITPDDLFLGIFGWIDIVVSDGFDRSACADFVKHFGYGWHQGHHPLRQFHDFNGLAPIIHELK